MAGNETVDRLFIAGLGALQEPERRLGIDHSRRGRRRSSTRTFVGHRVCRVTGFYCESLPVLAAPPRTPPCPLFGRGLFPWGTREPNMPKPMRQAPAIASLQILLALLVVSCDDPPMGPSRLPPPPPPPAVNAPPGPSRSSAPARAVPQSTWPTTTGPMSRGSQPPFPSPIPRGRRTGGDWHSRVSRMASTSSTSMVQACAGSGVRATPCSRLTGHRTGRGSPSWPAVARTQGSS